MDPARAVQVRRIGLVVIIAGGIMIIAGIFTYVLVSMKLADQQITVSSDA
jgi:hypothetical protein